MLLKEIMTDDRLFRGKFIVLEFDFRQTANVISRGSKVDIIEVKVSKVGDRS